MSQRLNQNLSRPKTTQEIRCGGDKITKNRSAEQYKRKAELLQDQLTATKAQLTITKEELTAAKAELSQVHGSPQWRWVTLDFSDIQPKSSLGSDVDRNHCKRCNKTFSKPSYLQTHPCWPGHTRESFSSGPPYSKLITNHSSCDFSGRPPYALQCMREESLQSLFPHSTQKAMQAN